MECKRRRDVIVLESISVMEQLPITYEPKNRGDAQLVLDFQLDLQDGVRRIDSQGDSLVAPFHKDLHATNAASQPERYQVEFEFDG